MRKWLILWVLSVAWASSLQAPLRAQMSDEEKKQLFLRAREDIHPVSHPSPSATPRPKPRTVATPEPEETPRPHPRATPKEEDEPTPRPKPKATPEPEENPRPRAKATPDEDQEPAPHPKSKKGDEDEDVIPLHPAPTPEHTPPPKEKGPPDNKTDAPISIEKSGLEEDQGFEPPPKYTGGWFRRWRYLSPAVRKAIDQAPVKKGRWKYIIVHNSGTRQGNARIFDVYHRRVRKMQNGLAYHFVIGNGSSSGDGEIEIGDRWTRQINGGHVASDYLNNIALGICLVGDYNRDLPTKAQMAALDELITYLRGRVGKIKGKPSIVLPHKKINPKPTDCPGDRFPYGWLQQRFGS